MESKSNPIMLIAIILSIVLGIVCGMYFPDEMLSVQWIGTVFMNMLKLIVLPLVFSALVASIGSMGSLRQVGSIGGWTLGYVFFSVSVAVVIGLVLINVFQPGVGVDPAIIPIDPNEELSRKQLTFDSFVLSLFPPNIVEAAAKFEMMSIVIFSVVFAIGCLAAGEEAKPVIAFFVGVRRIFIKMIIWLMFLTPIGLFSLLGSAIAQAVKQNQLMESVLGVLAFIVVFMFGLLLQVFWQLMLMAIITKRNPIKYLKAASGALATAFGTSSSMATLPVAMVVAQEQGIRDEVTRFVLPFATTINLAGTAMYEAVCALFFCQVLGIELSLMSQIALFITAIFAGMGATGIPEGGLVTMVTVLRATNVPVSAIAVLLPFDRILDRFRTMVNVTGDLVCAALVDHFTRKKGEAVPTITSGN
ncbi:MAG: dicarboxylate/amino acid:cation symporter [Gammaproteobacteria bacterium]